MPLWLFDPAEPSASPTYRPTMGDKGQSQCGGSRTICNCVPRYWRILAQSSSSDSFVQRCLALSVLNRDLGLNWLLDRRCRWAAVNQFTPVEADYCVLTYTDLNAEAGGEGGDPDWAVLYGTSDTGHAAIYTNRADPVTSRIFRCCSANVFVPYSDFPLFPGFPTSIIAQPFWP